MNEAMDNLQSLVYVVWFGVAVVALYFLPTLIALRRKVANLYSIAAINLFLGWTLVGWVASLALALRDNHGFKGSSATRHARR